MLVNDLVHLSKVTIVAGNYVTFDEENVESGSISSRRLNGTVALLKPPLTHSNVSQSWYAPEPMAKLSFVAFLKK